MKLILAMFLLSSTLFAQDHPNLPLKKHYCEAVKFSMKKYEELHTPAQSVFCVTAEDCTYLRVKKWKPSIGINRTALAGYLIFTEQPEYKDLAIREKTNCSKLESRIEFPLPKQVKCISNECIPIFTEGLDE
jgi:hypothetical protein